MAGSVVEAIFGMLGAREGLWVEGRTVRPRCEGSGVRGSLKR